MTATKAQLKAIRKYEAANYDKVLVRLPKGTKERIKEQGFTLNSFVSVAVMEKLDSMKG